MLLLLVPALFLTAKLYSPKIANSHIRTIFRLAITILLHAVIMLCFVMLVCQCCCFCRLCTLELGSCAITDEGLSRLVRTCHGLTALNIGQCSCVTDKGLSLIAENLQNLESIDLYGCTKITTVGLQQIMKLPKLSTLNLGLWHKWWSSYFAGLWIAHNFMFVIRKMLAFTFICVTFRLLDQNWWFWFTDMENELNNIKISLRRLRTDCHVITWIFYK